MCYFLTFVICNIFGCVFLFPLLIFRVFGCVLWFRVCCLFVCCVDLAYYVQKCINFSEWCCWNIELIFAFHDIRCLTLQKSLCLTGSLLGPRAKLNLLFIHVSPSTTPLMSLNEALGSTFCKNFDTSTCSLGFCTENSCTVHFVYHCTQKNREYTEAYLFGYSVWWCHTLESIKYDIFVHSFAYCVLFQIVYHLQNNQWKCATIAFTVWKTQRALFFWQLLHTYLINDRQLQITHNNQILHKNMLFNRFWSVTPLHPVPLYV